MFINIFILMYQAQVADTVRLRVEDAVRMARRRNWSLVQARAESDARAQGRLLASRAFLPQLSLRIDAIRTTDPVQVFGTRLRQERFRAADFDLDALNRPAPLNGYSISAELTQPIVSPEGIYGYRTAGYRARAQKESERHMTGRVVFATIRSYWDAVLMRGRVRAVEAAIRAARQHRRKASDLRAQGVVTGLDEKRVQIRLAELEARQIEAETDLDLAIGRLRLILGLDTAVAIRLVDTLAVPVESYLEGNCTDGCVETRGDVGASSYGVKASESEVKRAIAANLPSLVAFSRIAHYSGSSPFASGSGDWTVGVALVWNPFRALSGVGEINRARAERAAARAGYQAAMSRAREEIRAQESRFNAARKRLHVARERLVTAQTALEQARLRYSQGVSDITELLDVRAQFDSARLGLLQSLHDVTVARALFQFVRGDFDP